MALASNSPLRGLVNLMCRILLHMESNHHINPLGAPNNMVNQSTPMIHATKAFQV